MCIRDRNNTLYEDIKSQRAKRPPDRHNYTSYYDKDPMEGINWSNLRDAILEHSRIYFRSVCPKSPPPSSLRINAWWNLYDKHNHHCWHAHGRSLFSGTFYVYIDDRSVPIEFRSPIESLVNSWQAGFGVETRWAQTLQIHPSTNDLLIWPSWVDHNVPEQKVVSDNLRCSISFNVISKLWQ